MTKSMGTCARCDQPAVVMITDACGNGRCAVHAQAIFGLAMCVVESRDRIDSYATHKVVTSLSWRIDDLKTEMKEPQQ
jgi:hypothetical protein